MLWFLELLIKGRRSEKKKKEQNWKGKSEVEMRTFESFMKGTERGNKRQSRRGPAQTHCTGWLPQRKKIRMWEDRSGSKRECAPRWRRRYKTNAKGRSRWRKNIRPPVALTTRTITQRYGGGGEKTWCGEEGMRRRSRSEAKRTNIVRLDSFFFLYKKCGIRLEEVLQSDPDARVRPHSAWGQLRGGIVDPWSHLCFPPSPILSTRASCSDGASAAALSPAVAWPAAQQLLSANAAAISGCPPRGHNAWPIKRNTSAYTQLRHAVSACASRSMCGFWFDVYSTWLLLIIWVFHKYCILAEPTCCWSKVKMNWQLTNT